jgi:hypothetical protein
MHENDEIWTEITKDGRSWPKIGDQVLFAANNTSLMQRMLVKTRKPFKGTTWQGMYWRALTEYDIPPLQELENGSESKN